jgi:hypothetical protein
MDIVERSGTAIAFPTRTLHLAEERFRRGAASNIGSTRESEVGTLAARRRERPAAGA